MVIKRQLWPVVYIWIAKARRTVGGFNDFAGGAMAEMDFQIHFETEQNKAQWDLCDAA